ncbi:MAG: enoyl-CoA hydratase [Solirubrobacteraceae bacterium]|nr:enoyl-CoA hydratase [Solirubrobacteraceae bacterium]
MAELVTYEVRGAAAWITLNRPRKLNALSRALVEELAGVLGRAEADDQARVVVLTGAGRAFSAGYDLAEEAGEDVAGALRWHEILSVDVAVNMRLLRLSKPTIAAVRGWCLAGGCELAMACDIVVAADDARFGEPEVRYGSGPATLLLPFVVGQKKAAELLFTGDVLDAHEAQAAGLVNRVVASDELDAAVDALVARIAPTPLSVLRLTKIALTRAYDAMGLGVAVNANLDLSAILNAADEPEQREFDSIVRADGLAAALAWRDARFGEHLGDGGAGAA